MNHLEEAKKLEEYYRMEAEDNTEEGVIQNWILAHALIAIAEQLERMNNQHYHIEESDYRKIVTRKD